VPKRSFEHPRRPTSFINTDFEIFLMGEEWEDSIDDRISVPKPIAEFGELVYINLVPGVFLFKTSTGYSIHEKSDKTQVIISDYTMQSSFSAIYAGNKFP